MFSKELAKTQTKVEFSADGQLKDIEVVTAENDTKIKQTNWAERFTQRLVTPSPQSKATKLAHSSQAPVAVSLSTTSNNSGSLSKGFVLKKRGKIRTIPREWKKQVDDVDGQNDSGEVSNVLSQSTNQNSSQPLKPPSHQRCTETSSEVVDVPSLTVFTSAQVKHGVIKTNKDIVSAVSMNTSNKQKSPNKMVATDNERGVTCKSQSNSSSMIVTESQPISVFKLSTTSMAAAVTKTSKSAVSTNTETASLSTSNITITSHVSKSKRSRLSAGKITSATAQTDSMLVNSTDNVSLEHHSLMI